MKKTLFTLLFGLIATIGFAQTESPHLSFKGVPIDGTLNEYVQKMKQKGFTYMNTKDGLVLLKGDFAAYKECTIGVATLRDQDLVSKIVVMFPKCETWSALADNYYNLKEMLTEKYGKPANVTEEFQGHSEPKDDNSRYYYVTADRCKYITTFETPKGDIQLSLSRNNFREPYVVLSYFDKINSDIVRAKAMGDL